MELPNIHPGEILKEEFLAPMGISQNVLPGLFMCHLGELMKLCTENVPERLTQQLGWQNILECQNSSGQTYKLILILTWKRLELK